MTISDTYTFTHCGQVVKFMGYQRKGKGVEVDKDVYQFEYIGESLKIGKMLNMTKIEFERLIKINSIKKNLPFK